MVGSSVQYLLHCEEPAKESQSLFGFDNVRCPNVGDKLKFNFKIGETDFEQDFHKDTEGVTFMVVEICTRYSFIIDKILPSDRFVQETHFVCIKPCIE